MAVELLVGNKTTELRGLDRKVLRELEKLCSYLVQGHRFSPAFRKHRWDGREHLLTFSKKHGYSVPSGMTVSVVKKLKNLGISYKVKDVTVLHHTPRPIGFAKDLRDYQEEAIKAILSPPFRGRGILKMVVRSGKTRVAAAVISRLGLPTLFLVPSKGLLHQTVEVLSDALPDEAIGMVGDGVCDVQDITVATMQTLTLWRGTKAYRDAEGKQVPARKRDPRYNEVMKRFDVVIVDECHRITGASEVHRILADIDARYKMGLSATAFPDNETEQSRGVIWMQATCGLIRYELNSARLVEDGHLMGQNVEIYTVKKPNHRGYGWSHTVQRRCIIENKWRNKLIAKIAKTHVGKGLRVLVIARLHDHINLLKEAMEDLGLHVWRVTGKTHQSERENAMDALAARRVDVLLGNVLGEGIDLPEVEVIINAEGGKDDKNTVQRQRNLTIAEGKTQAILIDFLDETNEKFEEHSRQRIAMYESDESTKVKVFDVRT